jgi:hypothetical protein
MIFCLTPKALRNRLPIELGAAVPVCLHSQGSDFHIKMKYKE